MTFPTSQQSMFDAAQRHQERLTKPPGSLGRLEGIASKIAGYQASETPRARPCSALLFASDHPVTCHGVTPYPSEVTRAMLANFVHGGAAASVLARQHCIPLHVFDVGVNGEAQSASRITSPDAKASCAQLHRLEPRVSAGDIRIEDALNVPNFERCLAFGRRAVEQYASDANVIVLGEMGIGNTTPAAAIAAYLQGDADGRNTVGAGTGARGQLLESKRQVTSDVLERLPPQLSPFELLRRAGGRELAALAGAMQAALQARKIVLVDGFIVTTVAAVLIASEPLAQEGMIFSHCSAEHGHRALLAHLGARPLLHLDMRLGEASGALAAFSLLESACNLHNQMATFESAQIPEAP